MPVLIEAYGDSTTEGAIFDGERVLVFPEQSEPWAVKRILDSEFGIECSVPNYGVGGAQAIDLICGSAGYRLPWHLQMRESKASIVLINFAHNDYAFLERPEEGRRVTRFHEFRWNVEHLCKIALEHGIIPVLQEPNPGSRLAVGSALVPYVEAINEVADQVGCPVVRQFYRLQQFEGWQGMLSDTVHPGERMYQLKAQETAKVLAQLIASWRLES
ncbi:SGNH/GDSL hydrolase family protein [Pseudomonas sp. NY15181]|uniref:SGNH/GDSL hydrolase family protein n=1 Tax=Pseudomonas sp. NY15181 TaxID=3400349 RepID=UPI003A8B7AC6